jgi:Putative NAD(P)-binding
MAFASALARFNGQTVLLVGSDAVAASLVRQLLRAGARVRWFSRDVDVAEELWLTGEPRQIEIAFREPRVLDFEEAAAVIATVGEPIVFRLSEQAREAGCAVAEFGRPELSTFSLDEDDGKSCQKSKPHGPRLNATSWDPPALLSVQIRRVGRLLSSLASSSDAERSALDAG